MRTLYRSDQEYKQHSQAIESIANQYHYKNSDIRVIYENVLSDLEKTAKCRQFLSVLTMRHVKSILHESAHESAPLQQGSTKTQ